MLQMCHHRIVNKHKLNDNLHCNHRMNLPCNAAMCADGDYLCIDLCNLLFLAFIFINYYNSVHVSFTYIIRAYIY